MSKVSDEVSEEFGKIIDRCRKIIPMSMLKSMGKVSNNAFPTNEEFLVMFDAVQHILDIIEGLGKCEHVASAEVAGLLSAIVSIFVKRPESLHDLLVAVVPIIEDDILRQAVPGGEA